MRKVLLFLVAIHLYTFSQSQPAPQEAFQITGSIAGIADNSIVYLAGLSETDTIAKATVNKGSFVLKGTLNDVDGKMLFFAGTQKRIFLFIGNEPLTINAGNPDLTDLTVTGSSTHTDYEEFVYEIKPLGDFVNFYRNQMQQAQTKGARDSAAIMLNASYNIYQTSIDRFIGRRFNSPVASLVLAFSYDMDPNKDAVLLEKRMELLEGKALQTRYAQGIKQVIEYAKVGAIGSKAPEFTQADTLGKNVTLSQFKGKYVLVDFWASWCGPCRKENPNVVAAYNQFKNKNFAIIGVSLDQNKESWLQAIKTDHLAWTHLSDLKYFSNEVAQMYHVQSIPQNFLIDPNGIIIAKNLRGEDLKAKLTELLK